jgi:hypothetical protein
MRRAILASLLFLIFCCTTVQAQDKVPAALQQRLVAFTDQVWAAWMKSGDIRSIASMRVPEIISNPPCGLVVFTDEEACQAVSKEERSDHLQTNENISGFMIYRMLSKQSVFDLMKVFENASTADDSSGLKMMMQAASFTDREISLLSDLLGRAKDKDEFRRRLPQYKELESMLKADHLKDFARSDIQEMYKNNFAIVEAAMKSGTTPVTKMDGLPDFPPGEYFAIIRGLQIFVVRVVEDRPMLACVQIVTK